MKTSDPARLLPLALAISPWLMAASPADHTHHRAAAHTHHSSASSAGQQALARAQAARKALEAQQAQEAATLRARQQAATQAQQKALQDNARKVAFAAQTRTAQTAVQTTRSRIDTLNAEIDDLKQKQASIKQDIAHENEALQPLLPVAARLSIAPDAALLASPSTATDSVTALSILGGFSRLTQQRAAHLQEKQNELQTVEDALDSRQKELDGLLKSQTRQRDVAAARTKVAARQETLSDQAAKRARSAVAEAMKASADLSAEIETIARQEAQAKAELEAEARALAKQHQMEQARKARAQAKALSAGNGVSSGSGHAPVSGHVAVRWGQDTEAGPATGITYAAASSAAVQAPCSGRIVFSGPFRSFGQMLILDCGQNYRFVLSGLGSLGVSSGQSVRKAATLGQMPASDGLLFVQLRHGAQIVSPAPFL
ncbi:peptidoglycan DD-metalloendopeptidase family protein [Gluconobacter japonicus]|uniref:murein hydrolase activator EnvC family protein n=1 Tax=Gluconobacter japonicus TaxID=376620 RepID=UPI0024AD06E2|nr:peptidoglycan DD-metalloendopeptidase family protein [Gluconobacter japonicus]MDI6652632.1 peptidoglycan DD-metalloendopeptidase family protein [Gluconobacter japonicus]